MTEEAPTPLQKLDSTLRRLDDALRKRIQLEENKRHQECEKLLSEIMELKRQIESHLTEIKTLKTIIRETASGINEVIEIMEKARQEP